MPKNYKLQKVGNIYFSNNVTLSKNQKITADAFAHMWKCSLELPFCHLTPWRKLLGYLMNGEDAIKAHKVVVR